LSDNTWLEKLISRSKGRKISDFQGLSEYQKSTDCIKSDRYDRQQYSGMRDSADALKNLAYSRFEDDPSWPDIVQDEFLGLYKAVPKLRADHDIKPTHAINHAAMKKALSSKEWSELRTYTELDEWSSAMAAVEFGTRLGEYFDEAKDLQKAQEEIQEADAELEQALQDAMGLDEGSTDEQVEAALDALQQASQAFQQAAQQVQETIKANDSGMRQAVRGAMNQALDSTKGVEEMLTTFGTEAGSLRRMDHKARMKLAARIHNNKKLREMADMIGRMVRLALGEQARKIIHGHDEVHDIELGQDIYRVLPSDLALLSIPETELLFYKRFSERELLQYQLRGTEKVARGAIICMIDSSGSMSGQREIWSKAVGIALLNIANKQNRDFYAILFSSRHDQMREWYFPRGKGEVEDVLDFAEYFIGGGTDFEMPITRAVEVLERQFSAEKAQKGDLMLITDGECTVSTEWRDRFLNSKADLAFRMYSCLIGFSSSTLDVLSDQMYHITDLADGDQVRQPFGLI
jgi:uncharacterized protein with von Willebrand factor type A (vWA) domain